MSLAVLLEATSTTAPASQAPNILQIAILAVIQGLAELLPVSSSAHVVVAEKLMRLDPTTPDATFVLVMLHTGTMFAVIVYFWKAWMKAFFSSMAAFQQSAVRLIAATLLTGAIGYPLMKGIEFLAGRLGWVSNDATGQVKNTEIEDLFGNLGLISAALAVVGALIIVAGASKKRGEKDVGLKESLWIGAVQGLCLPFRGFSRSGATISTGLLLGSAKARVEEFSFALAVVLTPAVVGREALRLVRHKSDVGAPALHMTSMFAPGLIGLVLSFGAGLVALLLLSRVLEKGRWQYFGYYCLAAAAVVLALCVYGF